MPDITPVCPVKADACPLHPASCADIHGGYLIVTPSAASQATAEVFVLRRELDHEDGWTEGVYATLEAAQAAYTGWEQVEPGRWSRTDSGGREGHSIERWSVEKGSADV